MPIGLNVISKFDDRGIRDATSGLGKLGKGLAGVGIAAGAAFAAVGAAGAAFVVASAKQLMEIEKLNAQTNAAILSTGSAAGKTVDDINKLNASLEKLTGVEAEVIQEGQNMLLTFTNITGDHFDEATKAALDLSVALGKDMQSAAMLVGKALNDPIAGMGALSKAGIQFTEDQKAAIEAMLELNDTAGAQSIILGELNRQFGGSAEAFGETTAGQLAKIAHMFGEIGEAVAEPFLEVLGDALPLIEDVVSSFLVSPEFAKMLAEAADSLVEMAPSLVDLLPKFTELALKLIPMMIELIPVLIPVIDSLTVALESLAEQTEGVEWNLGELLKMVGILVSPIGTLIYGVIQLQKNFDDFGQAVGSIFSPLGGLISFLVNIESYITKIVNGWNEFISLITGKPKVSAGYSTSGYGNPAFANMPRMAEGGVVMPSPGGSIVNVAEAGRPEAIIPLDRLGKMGGGGGNSYTINVTAGVGDPAAIGQQIVTYIKKFERSGGPVFVSA